VDKNGGIIVSIDGIQPDKGNETIYLVRDALTGRVLVAENVLSWETAVMKALLALVVALGVKVLGTISDAQESELLALQELWPQVPHQVCQFHVLRDASKTAFSGRIYGWGPPSNQRTIACLIDCSSGLLLEAQATMPSGRISKALRPSCSFARPET
jgi:hypothetical protein